jgi:L-alanine-DL-glutamate epimerase-like enolase superfamily enzyme
MKIESLDLFYLAMPVITAEADGSQDALLVRACTGDYEGWGECEAAPLACIAAYVGPMSHGSSRPVCDSILGREINDPKDIAHFSSDVGYNSMDVLQAPHILSGIEMALWDLLGKQREQPVWQLIGYKRAFPKLPYASMLFGQTAEETLQKSKDACSKGFRAVKLGWGPFGRGTVDTDADQLRAAREGLGEEGIICVDAGQIWGDDVEAACARIPALETIRAHWLEEPFRTGALHAYKRLSVISPKIALAGGEGAHNVDMARHLIDYGSVAFIQIDCGRIGGIGPAKQVADYAEARGVTYVNHTFTSHLALSASLQPFAGLEQHRICEYPVAPKQLALDITTNHLRPDQDGKIHVPDAPGLGMTVNTAAFSKYLVDVEIKVQGGTIYQTPRFDSRTALYPVIIRR